MLLRLRRGSGDFLIFVRNGLESCTTNPLEDCLVLTALLVRLPALAAVVRSQIVSYIAGTVRGTCGLDQDQALGRISDVHYPHSIFVVLLAVLVGECPLSIRRLKLKDDVA